MRWLAAILLLLSRPAFGESAPPACTAAREGVVACIGGRLCECRFQAGGTISGRPSGHRWDCGVLRPACHIVPPDLGATPLPELPSLILPLPRSH